MPHFLVYGPVSPQVFAFHVILTVFSRQRTRALCAHLIDSHTNRPALFGSAKQQQGLPNSRPMVSLYKYLVEERGPKVARRVVPANPGAPGERGILAEIGSAGSGLTVGG